MSNSCPGGATLGGAEEDTAMETSPTAPTNVILVDFARAREARLAATLSGAHLPPDERELLVTLRNYRGREPRVGVGQEGMD